jgi:transposase-like protein
MTTKNHFKYQCLDCGWTGLFAMREFARKCRPRCQGCGSTFLDLVTPEAKKRQKAHDDLAIESREANLEKQGFRVKKTSR